MRYNPNPLANAYRDVKNKDDKHLWNPSDCLAVVNNYVDSDQRQSQLIEETATWIIPVSQTENFLRLSGLLFDLKIILNKIINPRYEECWEELKEAALILSVSLVCAMYYAFSYNPRPHERDLIDGLAVSCCRLYRKFQQPKTHDMDPLDQEMEVIPRR